MKLFKKPRRCGSGNCVEVAIEHYTDDLNDGDVYVKDTHGNECEYDYAEWGAFVTAVKAGEFDLPSPD